MSAAKKDLSTFYKELRNIPLDRVNGANVEKLAAVAHAHDPNLPKPDEKNAKTIGTVYLLAAKIAHQTDLETFCRFFEEGEVPTLKLSKFEMQVLQGGTGTGDTIRTIGGGRGTSGGYIGGLGSGQGMAPPRPRGSTKSLLIGAAVFAGMAGALVYLSKKDDEWAEKSYKKTYG